MTPKRQIKYIIFTLVISAWALYLYILLSLINPTFDNNIQLEMLDVQQKYNANSGSNIIKTNTQTQISDILLTIIPPEIVKTLILTYGVEYCNSLSYLIINDPDNIDWIRLMFKNLSEYDLLRLIAIIHSMNDRQVKELIDLLIQYDSVEISNIIKIFIKLDTNNLIFLFRDLDKQLLRNLLEMLLNNKAYKILLIYDQYELKRLMDRIHDDYWILPLMFEMKTDLHKLLSVIESVPNEHLIKLLWFFLQLNQHEKLEFMGLMNTMNPKHIIAALNMVYLHRNLVESSKNYFFTLKQRLGMTDTTLVIEKSINIASKVEDNTTRQLGVDKLQELRAVKIRRIIKQVDGNQFSGAIITNMVEDSLDLNQSDFDNYSNILSGDSGFIHGRYRPFDPVVSQERKIEVIAELYSGNAEKRQQHFDFMNGKDPATVPHIIELETVTKDPEPIIFNSN